MKLTNTTTDVSNWKIIKAWGLQKLGSGTTVV
jgi:hypothetical protein